MNRAGRRAASLMMLLGGILAVGASSVGGSAAHAAAPTDPSTTPAPATTTTTPPPPPPQTPPPTPAPTTTTIPYPTTVEADCAEFDGAPRLAKRLDGLKGDDGSTHLVILAEFCGVIFSDKAEVDPDLDRPWSNLEYAVRDEDEPFFTNAFDAVTANAAQAKLVEKASTDEWYKLHPELIPETTAPPTTKPPATTATSEAPTTTDDGSTTTTERDDNGDEDDEDGADDAASQTGSSFWQIIGVLILGVGAVVWGVSSVRRDPAD